MEINDWILPLYKIYSDDEDVNLITKIIRRGSEWAIGPEIQEFENAIANRTNSDYCICLNSGTSALHATLLSYGIRSGDEVIVPSFSFISTANSVLFVNATPKFSDIEESTFGLDPKLLSDNLSSKTKAVMPMDYGGTSCNISEIKEFCDENNTLLIEDAAESLGSTFHGKPVGSISDASIFSFCGNKVLTTGEGGAVVTNSKKIADEIKLIRSHGRLDKINYFNNPSESSYDGLGYNWRMSSITAGLGLSQIQKLDKIINLRKKNASYINSRLKKHSEIKIPIPLDGVDHIYQMYTIRLLNENMRNDLHKFLISKKIFSKVYFEPIHEKTFYKNKFGNLDLPITEKISKEILTLPLYPNMSNDEMEYLCNSISEFFENYEN